MCNKINEFLTQTKCPELHVPYDILLVPFFSFLQSLEEGNSKKSNFYPKIVFIDGFCSWCFFLNIAFTHLEENIQEI